MDCHFCTRHVFNGRVINSIAYCDLCLEKHNNLLERTSVKNESWKDWSTERNDTKLKSIETKFTNKNSYNNDYDDLGEFHNY